MRGFESISKMLSVLAHGGDYSYIDRLSYSQSKALALFYLKEALRSLHALKRSPPEDMPEEAKSMLSALDPNEVEEAISRLDNISGTMELRDAISRICASALALSISFVKSGEGAGA